MSKIKVVSKCAIYDGMSITFKAPCNSNAVDGINVYYSGTVTTFTIRDAHGANLAGKSNLFNNGAYVKMVLDTRNRYAYLQNADSNGYLETKLQEIANHISNKSNPHGVTAAQVGAVPANNNIVQYSNSKLTTLGGTSVEVGGGGKTTTTKREVILVSTTWTVPAGVTSINVTCVGGGAGGGLGYYFNNNNYYGLGGNAGATASGTYTVTPGASYSVTIGAGGTGGGFNGNNTSMNLDNVVAPTAGGTTSFGTLLSAAGGAARGSNRTVSGTNTRYGTDGPYIEGVPTQGGQQVPDGCSGIKGGVGAGGSGGSCPKNYSMTWREGGAGGGGACIITYVGML